MSSSVDKCVPINDGCLHVFPKAFFFSLDNLDGDVGDIVDVVASDYVAGGLRRSRSNAHESETMSCPLEAEVCS